MFYLWSIVISLNHILIGKKAYFFQVIQFSHSFFLICTILKYLMTENMQCKHFVISVLYDVKAYYLPIFLVNK